MSRPNTGIVPSRAIPAMDGWRSTAARPNGRCVPSLLEGTIYSSAPIAAAPGRRPLVKERLLILRCGSSSGRARLSCIICGRSSPRRPESPIQSGKALAERSGTVLLSFRLFVQLCCKPRNGHRADHILQQGREQFKEEVFHNHQKESPGWKPGLLYGHISA